MTTSFRNFLLLPLLWIQLNSGAPIDPAPFRYSRSIASAPEGLTVLPLDAAALAHSRADLADLRIADANNLQVPYVLEQREGFLSIVLPSMVSEKDGATEGQSRYRLELPFENLPRAKLVLTTPERIFERTISASVLRAAEDLRSKPTWQLQSSATWRHTDPSSPAPPIALDLAPSLRTTSVYVTVEEGDNRPLELSARLELPLYHLRFFHPPDGELTLLYGQETLSAPRYDFALLAPELAGTSSQEVSMAEERAAPPAARTRSIATYAFWTALVVAVTVVFALLRHLLRSEKGA